jgi:hypothetical protein
MHEHRSSKTIVNALLVGGKQRVSIEDVVVFAVTGPANMDSVLAGDTLDVVDVTCTACLKRGAIWGSPDLQQGEV